MSKWPTVSNYIIVVFIILILIIIIQGICIVKLLKIKRNNLEDLIQKFRNFWGEFIVYVLATSIIGLCIASLISEDNITLSDMNNWVSIVLGLVALIVGIISLWLSFYNVEQANKAKEIVEEKINEIKTGNQGWSQNKNGEWIYYLNGELARNQWKKSGDKWFYMGNDGYIEKEKLIFEKNGDRVYYVDSNGAMVRKQFVTINGKTRYFDESGIAKLDGKLEKDGNEYTFQNGVVINKIPLKDRSPNDKE